MSYEAYIKLKGNSNNTQEETQTGDDDVWEETQTDDIVMENKWTQCPVSYHSWAGKDVDWKIYLEDKRGYGTDEVPPLDPKQFFASSYNAKRLQNFVSNAAQVMTVLLEEEAHGFKNTLSLQQSDSNMGFSDGYIPIYCDDIDFLKDRRVTHVSFSPHFSNIVVTCYDKSVQPEEYLPIEITNRWLICLWDMIAISQPLKILVASAPVESIVFDSLYSDLLYAGLSDGIICLWDMSEPEMDHDRCRRTNFDTILRTPTYCSYSSGVDTKEIHTNPVICLRSTSSGRRLADDGMSTPTTLYSLSDDGKLLIWTVVRIPDNSVHLKKIDIRVSPWGRVRLALISVHHPRETAPREVRSNIDFFCMEVKQTNSSLLLGTNMGFVLQYPLSKFKTVTPRFGEINSSLLITDIELCPHDSRCFLVGVSDGSLRLHSEMTSRPLKVFTVSNLLASGISSVRWSNFKPGLIITLDRDSNLLVWNLCESDLQPVVKMSFKATDERNEVLKRALTTSQIPPDRLEKLVKFMLPATGMQAGPRISRMDLSRDIRLPYLGIVVSGATVHVHRFSNEFAAKGADIKNRELNVLRKYLDLLHK
uniref:WD repeat-containing protein 60 n=3 Tax=Lygus hesperus TaxID=30085 RepID=A0A0K8TCW8_LYGHE